MDLFPPPTAIVLQASHYTPDAAYYDNRAVLRWTTGLENGIGVTEGWVGLWQRGENDQWAPELGVMVALTEDGWTLFRGEIPVAFLGGPPRVGSSFYAVGFGPYLQDQAVTVVDYVYEPFDLQGWTGCVYAGGSLGLAVEMLRTFWIVATWPLRRARHGIDGDPARPEPIT